MSNIAAQAASLGMTGSGVNQANMSSIGSGLFGGQSAAQWVANQVSQNNAANAAQTLAQQQLASQGVTPFGGIASIASMLQGPQVGTAEQIAASAINDQDPNNLSFGSSYAGPVTQANSMMNPDIIEEATGNAPNNNITAGMAVGDAPIATAGNFNPQTEFAASRMFGNGTQFVKPKKLINL